MTFRSTSLSSVFITYQKKQYVIDQTRQHTGTPHTFERKPVVVLDERCEHLTISLTKNQGEALSAFTSLFVRSNFFWFSFCQTFVRRRSLWHDTRPGVYTNVVSHFSLVAQWRPQSTLKYKDKHKKMFDRKRYFCIFQKRFIFATVITEAKRKRRSLTWHCWQRFYAGVLFWRSVLITLISSCTSLWVCSYRYDRSTRNIMAVTFFFIHLNICHYSSKNVAQSALFKAHVDSRSCSRIHTATIWFVQTSLDTLVKTLSAKKKIHKMLTSGNLFSEGGQLSAQLASWQAQVLKMAYAHLVTEVLMCPAPVRV